MIHFVTDSTANVTPEEQKKYNIHLVPMQVRMDGVDYLDGVDISRPEFSKRLAEDPEIPTTSAPSLGSFVKIYQDIFANDPDAKIISVHMMKKLSSTVDVARMAAQQVEGHQDDIAVFDGGSTDRGNVFPIFKGAQLIEDGKSFEEVKQGVAENIEHTTGYLCINKIDYLVKGGRASKVMGFLTSMIKIKPIISLDHNKLEMVAKTHGKKALHKKTAQIVNDEIIANPKVKNVGLPYVDDDTEVQKLIEAIHEQRPDIKIESYYTGTSLMPHAGPEAYAILYNDDLA